MKILFLCGSIEPGQDGVGDYTSRIALELVCSGHEVKIISLYDKFISSITLSSNEGFVSIRLPYSMDETERFNEAGKNIKEFNPEWISIQFVIFAYHPKGLPFQLPSKMKALLAQRKVHIMFHELWVGLESHSIWKYRVLGFLQRRIIKHLLKDIQPAYIHTHTPLYAWQLKNIGFDSSILSLFGNIPISNIVHSKDTEILRGIVFGAIHSDAPIELFAKEFKAYILEREKTAEIIFVGRCGTLQHNWQRAFEKEGITCINKGEQTVERISELMMCSDFGITSTPYLLTDKSGTVAAMLEHGIPVICVAKKWDVREKKHFVNSVYNFKKGSFMSFMKEEKGRMPSNILKVITQQFLTDIKA
jgi:hypothetical protein